MALLNKNGRYIKVLPDGTYLIYASEEARNKVKASTPGEVILDTYRARLADLESQSERHYYDPEGFEAEYSALHREYNSYWYNFTFGIVGGSYPIMETTYPDIADSISEIIESGKVYFKETSIEDIYTTAKQIKRWGETTDV